MSLRKREAPLTRLAWSAGWHGASWGKGDAAGRGIEPDARIQRLAELPALLDRLFA
jgi:hypothetical protein